MLKSLLEEVRKFNLSKKIVMLILGSFLGMFVLCFFLFAFTFSYREQKISREALLETYQRIDSRANSYFKGIDMAAHTVMSSVWVQQLLDENTSSSQKERYNVRSSASGFLSSFSSMYEDLKCLIVMPDGEYVKNNNSYYMSQSYYIPEQEWYPQLQQKGKYRLDGPNDMFARNVHDASVTIYYQVRNIYNFRPMGFLVINIDYKKFPWLEDIMDSGEQILIRDSRGNIVYTNIDDLGSEWIWEDMQAGEISGNHQVMVYHDQLMDGTWTIWILKSNIPWLNSVYNNFYVFLLIFPVILIFMLLSLSFSRYLTIPIVLCTQALREIRNENYNVVIQNGYKDEIGDMIDGFNDMSLNIKRLIDQNRLMYKIRQQTEFQILQQRINPHFLCNTLEIINGMILCKEDTKAIELIGMLGTMYRYDLKENDMATIGEELEYLKNYLAILEYKYRDLQVFYEIDQKLLDYEIPKFICQPLVENTLKHGFRQNVTDNQVEIRLRQVEGQIHIVVMDNGQGIEPELLLELQRKIGQLRKDQAMNIQPYIGVLNTARRIFLHYGKESYFSIESSPGHGTRVEIHLQMEE
ncbi:MAG: histidine kinase [Lachnospiraceae bacterium]|nr:histidine kinase [Lachnospiraceae bacterium]